MFQLKSTGVESAAILLIVVDNERVDNWHFFFFKETTIRQVRLLIFISIF